MRWRCSPTASARRRAPLGALLAAVLVAVPVPALAHLGTLPPDPDAWLARGRAVVVLEAAGAPRPCAETPLPAVRPVTIVAVLAGDAVTGHTEVLLPAAPPIDLGNRPEVVTLRDPGPGDGRGCTRIPDLVVAGPRGHPPVPGAHLADWRRYARAIRSMSVVGLAGQRRLAELWASALTSGDPVLSDHAARRLAGLAGAGALPKAVARRLATVATDPSQPPLARALSVSLAGGALGPAAVARLARAKALPVAAAAVSRILEAPPVGTGGQVARRILRTAWQGAPALPATATPGDRIRRLGLAAALAGLGDPIGEPALEGGLGSRLFRLRDLAISGLAHLAASGDRRARAALEARRKVEPDARLQALLGKVLATPPPPAPSPRSAARRARRVGLRMLLVLLGLLALLGMALLPLIQRRSRRR